MSQSNRPIVACTIVTKNFLAHARALAQSLREHHPGAELYVLLADRVDNYFEPSREPFKLIQLDQLGDSDLIRRMCFYYTPFEFSCALRGALHEYMVESLGIEKWLFIDADILICGSLEPVWSDLDLHSLLLTIHRRTRPPSELVFIERAMLSTGVYNAGFVGLRRTPETLEFIRWFKSKLVDGCFNDLTIGLCGDQLWLNLVPHWFEDAALVSDRGVNVAYWNLQEVPLRLDSKGQIFAGDGLLKAFHFSGWSPEVPERVTSRDAFDIGHSSEAWAVLRDRYATLLRANGWEEVHRWPYAFATFPSGRKVRSLMRRAYHRQLSNGGAAPADPFAAEPAMWRLWARAAVVEASRAGSRYLDHKLLR